SSAGAAAPPPPVIPPAPTSEPVLHRETASEPRLVEAYATRTREQGEVMLILGWQEGQDANFVRGYTFELSFCSDGIKAFTLFEPMRRSQLLAETVESLQAEQIQVVSISWAQARRLLTQALDVNDWRGTEPAAEFKRHRSQIATRLLDEPMTETGK